MKSHWLASRTERYWHVAVLLILAVSPPAQGQPRETKLKATETYTNQIWQFQFPPKVAGFEREPKFTQYDQAGRDIGVGYNDLFRAVATTVFVYPIPGRSPDDTLDGHFGSCKAEVLNRHADAKMVSEGKIEVSPGGKKQNGLHATFTCTDNFSHQRQPVRSELYLFSHKKSFVLFRATYPVGQQATSEPAIKEFIDGLAWP